MIRNMLGFAALAVVAMIAIKFIFSIFGIIHAALAEGDGELLRPVPVERVVAAELVDAHQLPAHVHRAQC